MPKKKRIIHVSGKRWFDRKWGNTYFSCVVYVDGEVVGSVPYEYGYGDQYLQRAVEILHELKVYPRKDHYQALWQLARDAGDKFTYSVADVKRKKDL